MVRKPMPHAYMSPHADGGIRCPGRRPGRGRRGPRSRLSGGIGGRDAVGALAQGDWSGHELVYGCGCGGVGCACPGACVCVWAGNPGGGGRVAIRPASTRTVPRAGSQCPPPAATFRPTPGSCISDATTPGPGMMPRGQGGRRSPIYGPWLGHRLHCNHRQCLGSVIKWLPSIVECSILLNQSPRHNISKLFSTSGGGNPEV